MSTATLLASPAPGRYLVRQACAVCGGEGECESAYCPECHGDGAVDVETDWDGIIDAGLEFVAVPPCQRCGAAWAVDGEHCAQCAREEAA